MTEWSQPWDGTTLGNAAVAPYTADEWAQSNYGIFGGKTGIQNLSMISVAEFGNAALAVTGTATPVSVAAGHAMVLGRYYVNTAAVTVAIPTPAANPRVDRIVLRTTWATQVTAIARVAGTEAASPTPPALTQVNGTTWETSLAQVYVTTGGVITVRDERVGAMGLGPSTLFRDLQGREFEEFFEHFNGTGLVNAVGPQDWFLSLSSGTVASAGGESAVQLNTTSTGTRSAMISRGNTGAPAVLYPFELSKAPILFEARMAFSAAFDAQSLHLMRINSAAGGAITFGMIGSVSTTNLVLQSSNAGPTNFTTGQLGDATGAYHTYGIYLPASGGPAIAIYDGVAIGQVSATLPASTTDVTAQFFVGNGSTAADRVLKADWARWVRGVA